MILRSWRQSGFKMQTVKFLNDYSGLTLVSLIFFSFPSGIQNPADLEKNINMIPGVVDNGKKECWYIC